jgi:methionyl aminopeptidase
VISIKTPEEIKIMAEGGKIARETLNAVLDAIKPGVKTRELEKIADDYILSKSSEPSFKTVEDYDFATCININEGLVHGLPGEYEIKEGDLVSVDLGVLYKGFHTDLSHSVEVGTNEHTDFLKVGENALMAGISQCKVGNKIGDISNAMQEVVETAGYTVSRDLVGHGIGKELHEEPYVPGYGKAGSGQEIEEGMVFAIEIIYQDGSPEIAISEDEWTLETADKSISGLFENTVAATNSGPKVLTQ